VKARAPIVWEGAQIATLDGFTAVVERFAPGAEPGTFDALLTLTTPEGARRQIAFTLRPVGLEPVAAEIAALRQPREG